MPDGRTTAALFNSVGSLPPFYSPFLQPQGSLLWQMALLRRRALFAAYRGDWLYQNALPMPSVGFAHTLECLRIE